MKNIVLDIDGVILNFSLGFVNWYNKLYYPKLDTNPNNYNFDYSKETHPNDFFDKIQEYIDSKPDLELLEPSIPLFVNELNQKFNVIIVSSYPHLESRILNLQKYNIKYSKIYCGVENKIPIIKEINPVFIIEDCPKIIQELSELDYYCYVPLWNYTKKFYNKKNITIYTNIDELRKIIL
jgi:hypothetical protein